MFGFIVPVAGEVVHGAVDGVRYGDELVQVLVAGQAHEPGDVGLVHRAYGLAAVQQGTVGIVVQCGAGGGDAALAGLFGGLLLLGGRAAAQGGTVGIVGVGRC